MALIYHPYLLLLVIILQLISIVSAFSSSSSNINNQPSTLPHKNIKNYNTVQISKVQTNNDILSLAKLRYQEWMINEINPPLLSNFCKATAEIYNERQIEGSIVFLAKLVHQSNDGSDDLVVGAAELSSIELQNCIINSNSSDNNDIDIAAPLYITDVVTSSNHRRFGIGTKLMAEVERVALYELNSRIVLLHVEYDNVAARMFYEQLGYVVVVGVEECIEEGDTKVISISLDEPPQPSVVVDDTMDNQQHEIIMLDTKQLAINASTVGQQLMMKRLSKESIPQVVDEDDVSTTPQSPISTISKGGFGRRQQPKQIRKKKRNR